MVALLAIEPMSRPSSAAEVIIKLSGIAGLPLQEAPSVQQAYLTAPRLLGREAALIAVRSQIRHAARGHGGAVLLEGDAGSGRTRMLDVATLEAKLATASVLRTGGGSGQEWSGLRTLLAKSVEGQSECGGVAKELLSWLGEQSPAAGAAEQASPTAEPQRHARIHDAGRRWLLSVARQKHVVVLVDDFDRLDEPSASVIARVVQECGQRRLAVIATRELGAQARAPTAADLFCAAAQRVQLEAFGPEGTNTLLASVFGDAPGLEVVSARIHQQAYGNPRATMELAQELVDRGLARYEAGRWLLPERLEPRTLGAGLGTRLTGKLERLGDGARALADALSLTQDEPLDLSEYAAALGGVRLLSVHQALRELTRAGVVQRQGNHVRFAGPGWAAVLTSEMGDSRKALLHADIATVLAGAGRDSIRVARHRFAAGQDALAVEAIVGQIARQSRWDTGPEDYPDLLAQAIGAAEKLSRPRREHYALRLELFNVGRNLGVPGMHPHLRWLLAELTQASGLDDWHQQPEGLDDKTRLGNALSRAQARFDATPSEERILAPDSALPALATLVSGIAGFASNTCDYALLESLPSLAPFAPLAPMVAIIEQIKCALWDWSLGRHGPMHRRLSTILSELECDNADEGRLRSWLGVTYALAQPELYTGTGDPLARADELAEYPAWKAAAWDIRRLYHLGQGDLPAARHCEQELAALQLATGVRGAMQDVLIPREANWWAIAGDLVALKPRLDRLQALSRLHPGMEAHFLQASSEYERLRGNLVTARDQVEAALAAGAGKHRSWLDAVRTHLSVLVAMGDHDQVVRVGAQYVRAARERGVDDGLYLVRVQVAMARGEVGDLETAEREIEQVLDDLRTVRNMDLVVACCHDARARLAIRMADESGFVRHAVECRRRYRTTKWPALASKFEALLEAARSEGMLLNGLPSHLEVEQVAAGHAVRSEILEIETADARCELALRLLLSNSTADHGHLFAVRSSGLEVIASANAQAPSLALRSFASEFVAAEVAERSALESPTMGYTMSVALNGRAGDAQLDWTDDNGEPYEFVPLLVRRDQGERIVGVAALAACYPRLIPNDSFVEVVCQALVDAGDLEDEPPPMAACERS